MGTTRIGTAVSSPAVLGGGPFGHPFYVAFAAGGGYGGAEPNRKINVVRGGDLARPTVMEEWSNDAVALAWTSGPSGRAVQLAWTGTDPARRLNVGISWDGVGFQKTDTLGHTCLGGPALARHENRVMVAWAGGGGLGGGPPDGRVNVMWAGGRHVVLPWKSISAPALAGDPGLYWPDGGRRLYTAWTDAQGFIYTTYCRYDSLDELGDSTRLRRVETHGSPERTFTSPSLAFSGNRLYLAWAGTDGAHRVNFKILEGVDAGRKAAIGETASSAVAMQTMDGVSHAGDGRYAYRGTDGVGGVYVTDPMPL